MTYGWPFALYHDEEFPETDMDIEVVIPVDREIPASAEVKVYTLPAQSQVASLVYRGVFDGLEGVYQYLTRWISDQITAAPREIYIQFDENNPANHITEIQFLVAKA